MVEYNASWYKPAPQKHKSSKPKNLADAVIATAPEDILMDSEGTVESFKKSPQQPPFTDDIAKENSRKEKERKKHSVDLREDIIDVLVDKKIIQPSSKLKHNLDLLGLGDSALRKYLRDIRDDKTRSAPVDWVESNTKNKELIADPPIERFSGVFKRPAIMVSKQEFEQLKNTPGYAPYRVRKLIWKKEVEQREKERQQEQSRKEQELIDKFTKETEAQTNMDQDIKRTLGINDKKKEQSIFPSRLEELAEKGSFFASSNTWSEKPPDSIGFSDGYNYGGDLFIRPGNATGGQLNIVGKSTNSIASLVFAEDSCLKLADYFKTKREIIELKQNMENNQSPLIKDLLTFINKQGL